MKTSKTVAKLLFVVGALVYLVGLWISCPLLSGKGYFLGVLMTATFGNYAYLRAEKLGQLDDFFTHICQLVALITIGLGNDSNLLIVFYVQIMPDDFVMQLHR
ncbi:YiaA/YiaB family inner membrane protein, partial [Escherichia coli]